MKRTRLALAVLLAPVLLLSASAGSAPGSGAGEHPHSPPDVTISRVRGFVIRTNIGPGDEKQETVVPRDIRGYDYARLRSLLEKLRARYKKLPPLWLRAEKDVPWWVVVNTLGKIQKKADGKPLFPVVFLGPHEKLQEDSP